MFDWLFEIRDWIGGSMVDMWRNLGISPVYGPTVLMLILLSLHYKDFKDWENQTKHMKSYLKSFVFATSVLVIASILRIEKPAGELSKEDKAGTQKNKRIGYTVSGAQILIGLYFLLKHYGYIEGFTL